MSGLPQGLQDNQAKTEIGIEKLQAGFTLATIGASGVNNDCWLNISDKGIDFSIVCAAANIE